MRFLNSFFLSGHSGGFVKGALSAVSHTQMSLRIYQVLGSLPSPAVSPDPLVALLDSVFLQTHVWSANWGLRGFSREGRTAGPAARPLLGHLRLRLRTSRKVAPVMLGSVTLCSLAGTLRLSRGWDLRRLWQEDTPSLRLALCRLGILEAASGLFFPHICMSEVPEAFDDIQHPAPGSEFTLATCSAGKALPRLLSKHTWDRCPHPRQECMGFPGTAMIS